MKSIALFACDNGLGHIRRASILSVILSKYFKINLFAQKKKIKKFLKPSEVKIINFQFNFLNKKKHYLQSNYIKKFKSKKLSDFNALFSDNFPEVAYANKKTFIFANFFWHHEFDIKTSLYKNLDKELIKKKIVIFANYLFFKKYLLKYNLVKVPFFRKFIKTKKKNSILISFGTANYAYDKQIKNEILEIYKHNDKKKFKIFIEPRYYKKKYRKFNIYKATFSKKMYDQISVAYIKPGLGTIEECLMRGIPIVCYTHKTQKEFRHNAKIITKNKLGFEAKNFKLGFLLSKKIVTDKNFIKSHENKCRKLKWDGELKIAKYLQKKMK